MSEGDLYWLLAWATFTSPLSWFVCCLAVLTLWRWFHPVGVVMLGSVVATAILEAITTHLRFDYRYSDVAFSLISNHFLVTLIINTILVTLFFFALRATKKSATGR